MKKFHLYGLGAALVDTEIQVTDEDLKKMDVAKGHMTLVDEARQHELIDHLKDHLTGAKLASGGSAANSIIAASYFGSQSFYSCKVANDDNGRFYLQDIQAAGVATNPHPENTDGITGKCLVLISPDAERSMNTFLGASETLSVEELNYDAIASSTYFYYEGYLATSPSGREAAISARQHAEKHGVKTALSFSDPSMVEFFKNEINAMLGDGVDLVFCNESEANSWAGTDDVKAAAEKLKSVAKQFAITLGAKGALLYDGNRYIEIAGHAVKAVDTNGAGDMFAGAFLYAITQGRDFEYAGRLASLASARVVTEFGPRLAAETHQQILQNMDQ